jgi:hypothetical protein
MKTGEKPKTTKKASPIGAGLIDYTLFDQGVVAGGVAGAGAAGAGSVAGGVAGAVSVAGGVAGAAGAAGAASVAGGVDGAAGAAGAVVSVAGVVVVLVSAPLPKTKKAPAARTTISRMAMPQVAPPPDVVCCVTCGRWSRRGSGRWSTMVFSPSIGSDQTIGCGL